MCVQYIGGIPWVHWGISWVHRGLFSTSGDMMMPVGLYHEYIGGISWAHLYWKPQCTEHPLMYSWYPPMYSWYPPRCTHGIPPKYSWYPPDVLIIPRCTQVSPHMHHDIPWCTHDIPPMYSWYPPDVLNTPDVLMISPRFTEHPPMYSWYPSNVVMVSPRCTEDPPMYLRPPDVLNIPRFTEHTLYRVKMLQLRCERVRIWCELRVTPQEYQLMQHKRQFITALKYFCISLNQYMS